jgi:hypothetical protein
MTMKAIYKNPKHNKSSEFIESAWAGQVESNPMPVTIER